MIPVFEQNNAIFFYGTYYEGLECSPNCFYGGAVPNQFLTDYVPWVMKNLGTKFYIVGSDYIYPRTVSAIVQKLAKEGGGEIVADKYFPLGATEFGPTVADIKAKAPTVLFSNMVGDSTIAFYKQFSNAGFTPDTLPIAATVTTEVEVQAMGVEFAKGNYMTATYFQSLDNPANQDFVAAYKAQYGADAVTHMPLAGTYQSVYLWADAADRMISDGKDVYDQDALKQYLVGAQFQNAPEGIPINVLDNHHCNHPSYVGQTNETGQFDIVAQFPTTDADPFPPEIVPPDRAPVCPAPLSETGGGG
jgi:urea transport system substrate-binding protein